MPGLDQETQRCGGKLLVLRSYQELSSNRYEFAIDEHERGEDVRGMFEESFRPNMALSKSRFRLARSFMPFELESSLIYPLETG